MIANKLKETMRELAAIAVMLYLGVKACFVVGEEPEGECE